MPVADDDRGSEIEVSGEVTEVLDNGRVKVMLTATYEGQKVLGNAVAIVRVP